MAIYYKTGRSRTSRLKLSVTVMAAGRFPRSSVGATLLPGSSYTTVTVFEEFGGRDFTCSGYAGGFGVRPALGLGGSGFIGTLSVALGVVVPNTGGTGDFVPVVLVPSGAGTTADASMSVTATIRRVLAMVETRDHTNNGKRRDVYGSAGTCTEVYTVHTPGGDVSVTSKNHTSAFVPGNAAGALEAFGMEYQTLNSTAIYAASKPNAAGNGTAAEVTWSGGLVDASDDPLFATPAVPTESNSAGGTRWGRVYATACPLANVRHDATVRLWHIPRHAFHVKMEPRALPDGRLATVEHRIEWETSNPIDSSGDTSGLTLVTSGETYPFICGGTKWIASAAGGSAYYSNTYNDSMPLLTRVKVTASDANRHWFCHVGASWNAVKLEQARTLTLTGVASLSISSGGSQTVSFGEWIGYRFLRFRVHSTGGTGTLTIKAKVNGTTDAAVATITTAAADTDTDGELDLVESPGTLTDAALTLNELVFEASGAAFVVDAGEAFVKKESVVSCLSLRRALYPGSNPLTLPTESTPWIRCYTDGVLSLQAPSFDGSPVAWWAQTVRQLVQEVNGDALTSYASGWSAAEPLTFVQAGGSPPTYSNLLGWTLTDLAPPAGGKSYADGTTHEVVAYKDSDVYISALHGDGLVGGAPLLVGVAGGPADGLTVDGGEPGGGV